MWRNFFKNLSQSIAIDLGTSHILVYLPGEGTVIFEPSVVAVNTRSGQVVAVGESAKKMIGRTPPQIVVTRPLVAGVISDFEVTERMVTYFLQKIRSDYGLGHSRVRMVLGVPLNITEVERKAIEDAARNAGAREVLLVEEPLVAALGARLPLSESTGQLVVDLGGGTTEIAVLSLGGIVTSRSLKVAGDEVDRSINTFVREHFNLLLGERSAEEVKIKIGSLIPEHPEPELVVRGRDLVSGLPKEIVLRAQDIRPSVLRPLQIIAEAIRDVLEATPPELVADIQARGMTLVGGMALLRGLDQFLSEEVHIPVHIAEDPVTAVGRGLGFLLENPELLRDLALPVNVEGEVTAGKF